MNLFYTPDIGDLKRYTLSESESKHAIRVLRMKTGDTIHLVDGKGQFYHGEIVSDSPKKCEIEIKNVEAETRKIGQLHIAIAPTKNNDRMEWFVEKTTEIGIAEITPILCENSERKVLRKDRLEKRAIAAMKQSLKAHLPVINELIKLEEFMVAYKDHEVYIAHCSQGDKLSLNNALKIDKNVVILIGPEGDFSNSEIDWCLKNGAKPLSLGESRLRTETAGLFACTAYNILND